jgi:hypothetical protein
VLKYSGSKNSREIRFFSHYLVYLIDIQHIDLRQVNFFSRAKAGFAVVTLFFLRGITRFAVVTLFFLRGIMRFAVVIDFFHRGITRFAVVIGDSLMGKGSFTDRKIGV